MVLDDHQVADVEVEAHAAGGIGNEEFLDAHGHHHADGEDDQVHPVAFIVVDAALHRDDALPAELSDDEVAFVADGGGHGEAGNVLVGDDERLLDLVGQLAEAASQHDTDLRLAAGKDAGHIVRSGMDLFDSGVHSFVF